MRTNDLSQRHDGQFCSSEQRRVDAGAKPAVAYGDFDGLFDLLLYPAISPFELPGITNPIHQLADVDGPFDADDLIGQR